MVRMALVIKILKFYAIVSNTLMNTKYNYSIIYRYTGWSTEIETIYAIAAIVSILVDYPEYPVHVENNNNFSLYRI